MNDYDDNEGNIYADSVPKKRSSSNNQKKTNWVLWVILGIGGVGVAMLVCCGGLAYFGLDVVNQVVEVQFADHPAVVEHIGDLEDVSTNFLATGNESEKRGEDYLVFEVKGSKGNGKIIAGKQNKGTGQFQYAELIVNGEVIILTE